MSIKTLICLNTANHRFFESATNSSMASGACASIDCDGLDDPCVSLGVGRVAYHFGLGGEALTVGVAISTVLV